MSTSILRRILPLEDSPEFVAEFAALAAETTVCAVCGLGRMGHGPESYWLGREHHDYDPIPATPDMEARARRLTGDAYRARCAQSLCGAYCQSTH